MAHIRTNGKKVTARVRRIQGQLNAVARGVEAGQDCFRILQTAAACRGAFNGLLLELLDEHIRTHISEAKSLAVAQKESKELTKILRSYLK